MVIFLDWISTIRPNELRIVIQSNSGNLRGSDYHSYPLALSLNKAYIVFMLYVRDAIQVLERLWIEGSII